MSQERSDTTSHPFGESVPWPVAGDVEVQRDDELLTIEAAARRAGVSRATVLGWIRNGFIDAHTSKRGWVVRAGDMAPALEAANEARMGLYRHDLGQEQLPDPQTADGADEEQAMVVVRDGTISPAQSRSAEPFLAPFAEFVREQADIVQEQAETIGWLQAELRRTREQLAALNATSPAAQPESVPEPETAEERVLPSNVQPEPSETPLAQEEPQEPSALYDIIAADPFSDEADRARKMIEETEEKITALWIEQAQQQERHTRPPSSRQPDNDRWLRRLVSSWKRQSAG